MVKLYTELADWWPLISPLKNYARDAAYYEKVMLKAGLAPSPSFLELGSGGGSNAYYLKKMFARVTLSDLSPDMLSSSLALNPECEHIPGDMRTLRLDRTFDVVFVQDAIGYMLTEADLSLALETIFTHTKAGGFALIVPDRVRETFKPSTDHGGSDGGDRSVRYLEWVYAADPNTTQYVMEFVFMLREGSQPTKIVHERHLFGLFSRGVWLDLLGKTGFQPEIVKNKRGLEVFMARKLAE